MAKIDKKNETQSNNFKIKNGRNLDLLTTRRRSSRSLLICGAAGLFAAAFAMYIEKALTNDVRRTSAALPFKEGVNGRLAARHKVSKLLLRQPAFEDFCRRLLDVK